MLKSLLRKEKVDMALTELGLFRKWKKNKPAIKPIRINE